MLRKAVLCFSSLLALFVLVIFIAKDQQALADKSWEARMVRETKQVARDYSRRLAMPVEMKPYIYNGDTLGVSVMSEREVCHNFNVKPGHPDYEKFQTLNEGDMIELEYSDTCLSPNVAFANRSEASYLRLGTVYRHAYPFQTR